MLKPDKDDDSDDDKDEDDGDDNDGHNDDDEDDYAETSCVVSVLRLHPDKSHIEDTDCI